MSNSDFDAVFRRNIQIISDAVKVEGELENSVLVNTFINTLKKDAEDAMDDMASVDIEDRSRLQKIQLRVALHSYLQRLIRGIDEQHKAAAQRVQDMEKDIAYEQK